MHLHIRFTLVRPNAVDSHMSYKVRCYDVPILNIREMRFESFFGRF